MKQIDAIILDLDGTLLNDNKEITEKTKKVLLGLKDDIKIILASARQFYRIKPYLEELGLVNKDNYTICFNGALVVNNLENILVSSPIDSKNILNIDSFILDNNIEWTYYTYDNRYKRNNIGDINEFVKENKIFKIVGISSSDIISLIYNNIPDFILDNVEVTNSEINRIEFVAKGMTKVNSIKLLLDKLNIDSENVIAIGDGDNDISMLEYVGFGIAMKNSPDIVKEKVDIITDYDNNEDGVGIVIEEILKEVVDKDE